MLCRNPFTKDGAAYPCGQCEPCRYNRRKTWAHRIMLEGMCHGDKVFVGLSYSELHAPSLAPEDARLPLSLKPKHMQDFLKRLRFKVSPLKLRYYLVGEYGDKTWRPHYHAILFGYPCCVRRHTLRLTVGGRPLAYRCCDHCALLQSAWPFGDVDLGTVTRESASYCAEYTVKKMTAAGDIRLQRGHRFLEPEFCRMSLRPGIGVDGMWNVAQAMVDNNLHETMMDVPTALRHGNKHYPLGRYLRGKLREMVGRDGKAPPEALENLKAEVRAVRQAAFDASVSFSKALSSIDDGRVLNMKHRAEMFKRRKVL